MSNLSTIVNSVVSKVNEHTNNYNTHIPMSNFASYHLIDGNLSVDNFVTTQGFNTTLYTGNGGTQSINTGIDMATQWGNDASETFGGLVWIKSRSVATSNMLFDTIRGAGARLESNSTNSEYTTLNLLSSFNTNGFSVGVDSVVNTLSATYASWNFQTTHRITGTTNHGKPYTCHYNPYTGFTIVKYEGSGLTGHEIPHHLGRKLGFYVAKKLNSTSDWESGYRPSYKLMLNTTAAEIINSPYSPTDFTEESIIMGTGFPNNVNDNFILYGWANSYFDESNKLIGNYEIGVYQGTGVAGNKVVTRGKPAWVMIKRLDGAGNWIIFDNQRGSGSSRLHPNLSSADNYLGEYPANYSVRFDEDGLTFAFDDGWSNTSGGQYLYMVAYDTNSNGGGSYYPKATDNANVQVNNALIPLAKGFDSNGAKNEIVVANETITGVTWNAGKNYPYRTTTGYGKSTIAPNYGTTNPLSGDFYNILTNKWYANTGTEITESRNYMNHIVHADNQGNPLFVEELPKTEYKDVVKANEYQGKNACTAWVVFDGTTTPPTIIDSYNVSKVIRTSTGLYDVYFKTDMDNLRYSAVVTAKFTGDWLIGQPHPLKQQTKQTFSASIVRYNAYDYLNSSQIAIHIFGGKN